MQEVVDSKIVPVELDEIQYCRVPKNGLPKNGQAGISPKFKNVLRLEK